MAAGRLSFTYGFSGPAVSIDTACSSALVAAHQAAAHLQRHGGDALSAGVNLMLAERTTAAAQAAGEGPCTLCWCVAILNAVVNAHHWAQRLTPSLLPCPSAGMLALDGHCKTLDAAADGYVRAEACIVLHLATSHGAAESTLLSTRNLVLRGTFVNQDGRSSSLTAPNGPAQQDVIRGALEAAGLLPRHISSLEMHGTGEPYSALAALVCQALPFRGVYMGVFCCSGRFDPYLLSMMCHRYRPGRPH